MPDFNCFICSAYELTVASMTFLLLLNTSTETINVKELNLTNHEKMQ